MRGEYSRRSRDRKSKETRELQTVLYIGGT